MAILVDSETRVICQGITGAQASFYTERAIAFGTRMVAGVRPGKGGSRHLGLPVFDRVADARDETGADASVVFVPRDHALQTAIIESIDARSSPRDLHHRAYPCSGYDPRPRTPGGQRHDAYRAPIRRASLRRMSAESVSCRDQFFDADGWESYPGPARSPTKRSGRPPMSGWDNPAVLVSVAIQYMRTGISWIASKRVCRRRRNRTRGARRGDRGKRRGACGGISGL